MSIELIDESKSIAIELEQLGYKQESLSLQNTIEAGTVGGEILMALRFNLNEILKNNGSLGIKLKSKMKRVVKDIKIYIKTPFDSY